ncbi:MAG TPA: GreA/GreB family elongation factor [Polyangiaceae bacterium]|nr:GreA/GreB family elongation factor [Polyangiaceae bacterium]
MSSSYKRRLLDTLVQKLTEERDRATSQANEAASGATHEENRAESDKDMRSTEASYVARGQAERVAKLEQAITLLSRMELRDFSKGAGIEASALVTLSQAGKEVTYFLVVAAGGERLTFEGKNLQTLATSSPLGQALLGLAPGDEAEVESPQGARYYSVTSVT